MSFKLTRKIVSIICALSIFMSMGAICFGTFAGAYTVNGNNETNIRRFIYDFTDTDVQNFYNNSDVAMLLEGSDLSPKISGFITAGMVLTENEDVFYGDPPAGSGLASATNEGQGSDYGAYCSRQSGFVAGTSTNVAHARLGSPDCILGESSGWLKLEEKTKYEVKVNFRSVRNTQNDVLTELNGGVTQTVNNSARAAVGIGCTESTNDKSYTEIIEGFVFGNDHKYNSGNTGEFVFSDKDISQTFTFFGDDYTGKYLEVFTAASMGKYTTLVISSVEVTVSDCRPIAYVHGERLYSFDGTTETVADAGKITNSQGEFAVWRYLDDESLVGSEVITRNVYASFPQTEVLNLHFTGSKGIYKFNSVDSGFYTEDSTDISNITFKYTGGVGSAVSLGKDNTVGFSTSTSAVPDADNEFVFEANTKYTIQYKYKFGAGTYCTNNQNTVSNRYMYYNGTGRTVLTQSVAKNEELSFATLSINETNGTKLSTDWDGDNLNEGVTTGRYVLAQDTVWKTVSFTVDTTDATALVGSGLWLSCYSGNNANVYIYYDDVVISKDVNCLKKYVNNEQVSFDVIPATGLEFDAAIPEGCLGWFTPEGQRVSNGDVLTKSTDAYAYGESDIFSTYTNVNFSDQAVIDQYASSGYITGVTGTYGIDTSTGGTGALILSSKSGLYSNNTYNFQSTSNSAGNGKKLVTVVDDTHSMGSEITISGATVRSADGSYVLNSGYHYTVIVNYRFLDDTTNTLANGILLNAFGTNATATTSFRGYIGIGCGSSETMSEKSKMIGMLAVNKPASGAWDSDSLTFEFDGDQFEGDYLRVIDGGGCFNDQDSYFAVSSVSITRSTHTQRIFEGARRVYSEGKTVDVLCVGETIDDIGTVKSGLGQDVIGWAYADGSDIADSETITGDIYAVYPNSEVLLLPFDNNKGIYRTNRSNIIRYSADPANSDNNVLTFTGRLGDAASVALNDTFGLTSDTGIAPDANEFVFEANTRYTIQYRYKFGKGSYGARNSNSFGNSYMYYDGTGRALLSGTTGVLSSASTANITVNSSNGTKLADDWDGDSLLSGVTTGRYSLTADTEWQNVIFYVDTAENPELVGSNLWLGCTAGDGSNVIMYYDDFAVFRETKIIRKFVSNTQVSFDVFTSDKVVFDSENIPGTLGWFTLDGKMITVGHEFTESADVYAYYPSDLAGNIKLIDFSDSETIARYGTGDINGIAGAYGFDTSTDGTNSLILSSTHGLYSSYIYPFAEASNHTSYGIATVAVEQKGKDVPVKGAVLKNADGSYKINSSYHYSVTVNYKLLNDTAETLANSVLQNAFGSSASNPSSYRSFIGFGCSTTPTMTNSTKLLGMRAVNKASEGARDNESFTVNFDGADFANNYLKVIVGGGAMANQYSYFSVYSVEIREICEKEWLVIGSPRVYSDGKVVGNLIGDETPSLFNDLVSDENEPITGWYDSDMNEIDDNAVPEGNVYAKYATVDYSFNGDRDLYLSKGYGPDNTDCGYYLDLVDKGGEHGKVLAACSMGTTATGCKYTPAKYPGMGGSASDENAGGYRVKSGRKYSVTFDIYCNYQLNAAIIQRVTHIHSQYGSAYSGGATDTEIARYSASLAPNVGEWTTVTLACHVTNNGFLSLDFRCIPLEFGYPLGTELYYIDNISITEVPLATEVFTNGVENDAGGTVDVDYVAKQITVTPAAGYKLGANGIYAVSKTNPNDVIHIWKDSYTDNSGNEYFEDENEGGTTFIYSFKTFDYIIYADFVTDNSASSSILSASVRRGNGDVTSGIRFRGRIAWNNNILTAGFIVTCASKGTDSIMRFTPDGNTPSGVIARSVYYRGGNEIVYSRSSSYHDYQLILYGITSATESRDFAVRMYVRVGKTYFYSDIYTNSYYNVWYSYPATTRFNISGEMYARGGVDIPLTKDGRKLVWCDCFNDDKVDEEIWNYNYGDTPYDITLVNCDSTIEMGNGKISMTSHNNVGSDGYIAPPGFITRGISEYRYGYYEVKAKIPFYKGGSSSFWFGSTETTPLGYSSEIDLVELLGRENNVVSNLHIWGPKHYSLDAKVKRDNRSYTFSSTPEVLRTEMHTYFMEWTPDYFNFGVDGIVFYTFYLNDASKPYFGTDDPDLDAFRLPVWCILGQYLYSPGRHMGYTIDDDDGEFRYTMEVDYIAIYQGEGEDFYLKG